MNDENIILICKKIKFYSQKDEDAFFEWVKKITCIDKISATGDELYLHVIGNDLQDDGLIDLLGLFYRYNIDMRQLETFLTKKNKKWFFDGKTKGFWHRRVFGANKNKTRRRKNN